MFGIWCYWTLVHVMHDIKLFRQILFTRNIPSTMNWTIGTCVRIQWSPCEWRAKELQLTSTLSCYSDEICRLWVLSEDKLVNFLFLASNIQHIYSLSVFALVLDNTRTKISYHGHQIIKMKQKLLTDDVSVLIFIQIFKRWKIHFNSVVEFRVCKNADCAVCAKCTKFLRMRRLAFAYISFLFSFSM